MRDSVPRSRSFLFFAVSFFVVLMTSSPAVASPTFGRVIYSASFSSPVPKWHQSSTSMEFKNGAYVITSTSDGQQLIVGPELVRPQVSITLRASINADAPDDSGFGTFCLADYKKDAGFGVSFLIRRDGEWTISDQAGKQPMETLASGSVQNLDLSHETSVTATCDSLPKTRDMKLGLYIDGDLVSLLTELSPKLTKPWLMGIDVIGTGTSTTVVEANSFVIRNLAEQ
jgi:hypothetical protein